MLTNVQPPIITPGCYRRYFYLQAERAWGLQMNLDIMALSRIEPMTTRLVEGVRRRNCYWNLR